MIWLLIMLCLANIAGGGNNVEGQVPILSSEAAVERALAYTGFAKTQELSLSKEM